MSTFIVLSVINGFTSPIATNARALQVNPLAVSPDLSCCSDCAPVLRSENGLKDLGSRFGTAYEANGLPSRTPLTQKNGRRHGAPAGAGLPTAMRTFRLQSGWALSRLGVTVAPPVLASAAIRMRYAVTYGGRYDGLGSLGKMVIEQGQKR